jgi:hypothetical protein
VCVVGCVLFLWVGVDRRKRHRGMHVSTCLTLLVAILLYLTPPFLMYFLQDLIICQPSCGEDALEVGCGQGSRVQGLGVGVCAHMLGNPT